MELVLANGADVPGDTDTVSKQTDKQGGCGVSAKENWKIPQYSVIRDENQLQLFNSYSPSYPEAPHKRALFFKRRRNGPKSNKDMGLL